MKIDMSPGAVSLRLRQAAQLRRACLSLAKSAPALKIRREHPSNKTVQRTTSALGR